MSEVTIAHYQAVREEILARMNMRQTALTLYLGFVGVIFGLAAAENPRRDVTIVVPFIAFGVLWVIRDHELGLALLGLWLREDYQKHLDGNPQLQGSPQWDTSLVRPKYIKHVLVSRFIGYAAVFFGPSVVSLVVSWTSVILLVDVVSTVFTVGILILICLTFAKRRAIEANSRCPAPRRKTKC
jgi:hypothetical protein